MKLQASKADFKPVSQPDIHVHVTETLRLELHLELATRVEQTQVSSEPVMVQLDTSALGRVVNRDTVSSLPLVTRNFTQITGLSPGVAAGVYNAGELGTGATALSQIGKSNDGIFVHGSRSYDNNWQLDGISVSDVHGGGPISGGIPIPNPDMLEEFKVQTGLYDAAFGRAAGANVSVITKAGTNHYHGTIFEFLRNDVLNANDFFLNKTGQRRPDLKQNQFGFALGGPIQKDKLLFFGSYQGTRQVNGTAAGQARVACTVSLNEPPLTDDRSPQTLRAFRWSKPTPRSLTVSRISAGAPSSLTRKCRTPLYLTAFCRASCKIRNKQSEISFGTLLGIPSWVKSISTFCCSENSLQKLLAATLRPR